MWHKWPPSLVTFAWVGPAGRKLHSVNSSADGSASLMGHLDIVHQRGVFITDSPRMNKIPSSCLMRCIRQELDLGLSCREEGLTFASIRIQYKTCMRECVCYHWPWVLIFLPTSRSAFWSHLPGVILCLAVSICSQCVDEFVPHNSVSWLHGFAVEKLVGMYLCLVMTALSAWFKSI